MADGSGTVRDRTDSGKEAEEEVLFCLRDEASVRRFPGLTDDSCKQNNQQSQQLARDDALRDYGAYANSRAILTIRHEAFYSAA
jgi:hypothetical protein